MAFKQKNFYDCLLPGTLYLSVAAIPTLWNLYSIFLMIYFIFIVWMKERSAWRVVLFFIKFLKQRIMYIQ
ncbi:hypothetical protein FC701_13495 [Bacillus mycoides]|uniref:Uncharacterized protein n=1 Tax=Bacillus mycoides TaxID=1405 RepID=A0A4U3A8Z9_BACMY|nr:hypothetical protein FC701_13495 [Bacillus mycoides]